MPDCWLGWLPCQVNPRGRVLDPHLRLVQRVFINMYQILSHILKKTLNVPSYAEFGYSVTQCPTLPPLPPLHLCPMKF